MKEVFIQIVNDFKSYLTIKKELVQVESADSISKNVGNGITYLSLGFIGIFVLFFFFISVAIGLGMLLNNYFLGFFIVTLLFVIAAIVVWFNKDKFFRLPIFNSLVKDIHVK